MTETPVKRPRGTWRRRILIFLLGAILLVLLVRTGVDLWAGRRINLEVARLEQKYGSLDKGTLKVPPVPDGDNRARALRAAAALISGQSEVQASAYRFLGEQGFVQVPPDLRAFVETNRGALKLAHESRARRQSNWEVDYSNNLNHPPLWDIRTLSYLISLAARMDLEAGRPDEAATGIASGLALSASLRQESMLLAQLIRIAIASQHFQGVQRLVTDTEPSKASLEELARWLADNRAPDPMQVGLLGELKHFNDALARADHERGYSPWAQDSALWSGPFAQTARPLVRLFRVRYLEQFGRLLDVQTGPRPRPDLPVLPESMSISSRLNSMVGISGMKRAMDTGETFIGQLAVTELAVALRRHRLDHGQYPDALAALVPAYLASVPIDPVTGKAPTYVRQGPGFRLSAEKGPNVTSQMALLLDWTVPK